MDRKGFVVFLVLAWWATHVSGQDKQATDSTLVLVGSQMHVGRILPHSKSIAPLTDSWLWGAQADISRIRLTKASWDNCNCYSQNGLSLSYFNFGNPEELGKAFSAAVFVEPQLSYNRLNVGLRAGGGVSYLTRVYHPDENPRNLFFSRPWSGLLLLQVSGRYSLTPLWLLRVAASYHHVSNGGQKQPNKGMNFPALTLGVEYVARYQPLRPRAKEPLRNRSLQYYAGVSYNTRSVDESDFKSRARKAVVGIHAGFYKPLSRMHGLGVGLEFYHDNALKERAMQAVQSLDHRVLSGLIRHHFLFGRFDFSQALGVYLHKDYLTPQPVFQRYAIHYKIFDHMRIGFSLKAHLYTAEQMDVRLGVIF